MKCPMCDGTGTSNTCVNGTFKPCSFCDGTGEFDPNEVDRFNAVDVIKVMEMVKKPMTNEEWLHTLNTEQLAEAILLQWIHGAYHGVGEFGLTDKEIESARDDIVEWLKQPHQ